MGVGVQRGANSRAAHEALQRLGPMPLFAMLEQDVCLPPINNGHLSVPGNDGILNVPPDLLLLFPQGQPVPFALGRAVCGFQLPTVNELGLVGGDAAVFAVTPLPARVYAPVCEKSLGPIRSYYTIAEAHFPYQSDRFLETFRKVRRLNRRQLIQKLLKPLTFD